MRMCVVAGLMLVGCSSPSGGEVDGGSSGAGHFTYGVGDKVFRIEARVGASPQDVSAALERFGSGTRDRRLVPSHNGKYLVLSSDRLPCSMGECVLIAPADLSSLSVVSAAGEDVASEGTPAVTNAGDAVIFSSQEGPHEIDVWVTRKSGTTWGAATLLTAASSAPYNNMPALSFDEQRVFFDCGAEPYPESGDNKACEVKLDGSGFRVVVQPSTMANARQSWVQFPHDSLDGVLFEATWPIGTESPETIWQLPSSGTPVAIGRAFTNAVSPCGLPDGRIGLLWLSRPGNSAGVHELSLAARDGTVLGALTPNVDVADIGIGCSD